MVVPFYVPIPVPVAAPIDKLALEADPRMFQSLPEARKSASSRRESTCVVQCVSRSADKIQFVRSVKLRSEEHTSELQSLMRISYAVFCLKKKNKKEQNKNKTDKLQY